MSGSHVKPAADWKQLVTNLGAHLKSNKIAVLTTNIMWGLDEFAFMQVELHDIVDYIATIKDYPLRASWQLDATWDEFLRQQIIMADVLGNAVYSSGNLEDLVGKYNVDEKKAEQYIAALVAAGAVYKMGDVASFLANVRNKGKVAFDESQRMHTFAAAPYKIKYIDVEFPYDSTGRYVVDHLPEGWTYTTTDGMNIYSPP